MTLNGTILINETVNLISFINWGLVIAIFTAIIAFLTYKVNERSEKIAKQSHKLNKDVIYKAEEKELLNEITSYYHCANIFGFKYSLAKDIIYKINRDVFISEIPIDDFEKVLNVIVEYHFLEEDLLKINHIHTKLGYLNQLINNYNKVEFDLVSGSLPTLFKLQQRNKIRNEIKKNLNSLIKDLKKYRDYFYNLGDKKKFSE